MKKLLCVCLLALVLCPAVASADEPTPVVFAVDTSRSLEASELARVRQTLAETSARLPAGTALGLIAFNDEASWAAPLGSTPAELEAALSELRPRGNYTVLHDALFLASRELGDGGVIVVVTDGRDENSATTVDDVARLSDAQSVRILTVGVGRVVDQRALRRLALISRGEYMGDLSSVDAGRLAGSAIQAAEAVSTERREAATAASAPAPQTQPEAGEARTATAATRAEQRTTHIPWWAFVLGLAIGLVAMVVLWLVLKNRHAEIIEEQRHCETCGAALEPWESSCSRCEIEALEQSTGPQRVAQVPTRVAETAVPDESILDPAVFEKSPLPEGLDQTVVLDEQPVLITKERGKPPRTYALPRAEIFVVGRAKGVNTLQLDDPTVSGQHFKVVPKGDDFYVVDLGTTNGTSVNHERVKVRKLAPGDIIRVGMVEFEFRMQIRRMN